MKQHNATIVRTVESNGSMTCRKHLKHFRLLTRVVLRRSLGTESLKNECVMTRPYMSIVFGRTNIYIEPSRFSRPHSRKSGTTLFEKNTANATRNRTMWCGPNLW